MSARELVATVGVIMAVAGLAYCGVSRSPMTPSRRAAAFVLGFTLAGLVHVLLGH